MARSVTVVGLGPGAWGQVTLEAREAIASASEVWLRTARHPVVSSLPTGPTVQSFDYLYDEKGTFAEVYAAIVARLLELARRPEGVVYAVPGHPLVGDRTYGGQEKYGLSRQFLHAHRLAFSHPTSKAPLEFSSPLPPDLAEALEAARAA